MPQVPTVDKNTALALAKALGANSTQQSQVSAAFGNEPKVSDVYKEFKAPAVDPEAGRAIDTGISTYKDVATAPINEDAIRAKTLETFQKEIDATNAVYADKVREAKVSGMGRIGSGRAIQARSGLLGSDFGAAQTDKIVADNAAIENSIYNEKQAKIAEILGKGSAAATAEIAAKRKAQQEGLDSYLKFLSAKTERKTANLKAVTSSLITQGLKPDELDPKKLKELADSYGVTTDELVNSYLNDKKAYDEAKTKEAAAAAKDARVELSAGQKLFTLDPKTGKYVEMASAPAAVSTGTKNTVTIAEAKSLGLPISIVGKSQDEVISSLGDEIPPQWFADKAKSEGLIKGGDTFPMLKKVWDDYRVKINNAFGESDALY